MLAFAVISTLHTVLGEIVPKTFTLQNAERVALFTAGPVRLFFNCFRPFIWFLDWLADGDDAPARSAEAAARTRSRTPRRS